MTAITDAWLTANGAAVQDLLGAAYGITGTLHPLAGEYDLNLRVESGERRYLLKVMRRDCDAALVDMQCRALDTLAARLPGPGRADTALDPHAHGRGDHRVDRQRGG